MSNREIAKLAFKFFSVYVFVFALLDIPGALATLQMALSDSEMGEMLLLNTYTHIGSILLRIVFGIVLWFVADRWADRLVGRDHSPTDSSPVGPKVYLTVGIGLIGAYIATTGLVKVVSAVVTLAVIAPQVGTNYAMQYLGAILRPDDQSYGLVRLIIGLVMLFGARWFVHKLKAYPDVEEASAEETSAL